MNIIKQYLCSTNFYFENTTLKKTAAYYDHPYVNDFKKLTTHELIKKQPFIGYIRLTQQLTNFNCVYRLNLEHRGVQ